MCKLYDINSTDEGLRRVIGTFRRNASVGNFPPRSIFPDYPAPIVRNTPEGRELAMVRWGMPTPAEHLEGKKVDKCITNVRNTFAPHWRQWLGVEHRCVVPFTSFAEYDNTVGPDGEKRGNTWFAFDDSRPLAVFAGIWMWDWTGVRKLRSKDPSVVTGVETIDLFAFLTCAPNDVVGSIHMKAMPVILTEPGEIETWLTAPWSEAKRLQRPLPDGVLKIVKVGGVSDTAALA